MVNIKVTKIAENQSLIFNVIIEEEGSKTQHRVTLNKADYQKVTNGDVKPEVLVEKSFEYLLEQESKEQILTNFDFTIISRYFPNFLKDIKKRITE